MYIYIVYIYIYAHTYIHIYIFGRSWNQPSRGLRFQVWTPDGFRHPHPVLHDLLLGDQLLISDAHPSSIWESVISNCSPNSRLSAYWMKMWIPNFRWVGSQFLVATCGCQPIFMVVSTPHLEAFPVCRQRLLTRSAAMRCVWRMWLGLSLQGEKYSSHPLVN